MASATIALTGDVMLGRHVDEVLAVRGPRYAWGDLLPLLHEADLRMINLECALTSHTAEWHNGHKKVFYFRADPERGAATLEVAGVDFAALANNHIGDFGNAGLLETIGVLDRHHIAHAGAGANLAAARMPAVLNAGGLQIAVVAFADHPPEWAATPASPGINYVPIAMTPSTLSTVDEVIASTRAVASLVIATFHWGPNMRERPSPSFRAFAHHVIEAGADVFWGHSAHVVQGIEIWQGKPILYDTGDFLDDYAVDPELRNDLSALFLLRVSSAGIEGLDLIPVVIADCQVNRAHGEERRWFQHRIKRLCDEFGTALDEHAEGLSVRLGSSRHDSEGLP
jgi:poly-gamma-glutamate capsule biosynthesis protein CapA/YwtB (metallophosphatase superfamily)